MIVDTKKIAKSSIFSMRGLWNVLGITALASLLFGIFAGLPLLDYFTSRSLGITSRVKFGTTSTNSTGQQGAVDGFDGLVDMDTPKDAYNEKSFDGDDMVLIFSDEFNKDGRTFYPGDDPFWCVCENVFCNVRLLIALILMHREAMDFYYVGYSNDF